MDTPSEFTWDDFSDIVKHVLEESDEYIVDREQMVLKGTSSPLNIVDILIHSIPADASVVIDTNSLVKIALSTWDELYQRIKGSIGEYEQGIKTYEQAKLN